MEIDQSLKHHKTNMIGICFTDKTIVSRVKHDSQVLSKSTIRYIYTIGFESASGRAHLSNASKLSTETRKSYPHFPVDKYKMYDSSVDNLLITTN